MPMMAAKQIPYTNNTQRMTSREKLLKKFEEEYNRLNEQQRCAVDQTEGR
jgi:hypothetical protein